MAVSPLREVEQAEKTLPNVSAERPAESIVEFAKQDFLHYGPVDLLLNHLASRRPLSTDELTVAADLISFLSNQSALITKMLSEDRRRRLTFKEEDATSLPEEDPRTVAFSSRKQSHQIEANIVQQQADSTVNISFLSNIECSYFTVPCMVVKRTTTDASKETTTLSFYSDRLEGVADADREAVRIDRETSGTSHGLSGHIKEAAAIQFTSDGVALTTYDDFFSDRQNEMSYTVHGQPTTELFEEPMLD